MTSERGDKPKSKFRGTFTALVTPFRDGEIDWKTLDALVDRQVASGVEGVVPCGSTGESATLSHEEHHRVVEAVVARVGGRCIVLAGTGSNNTTEAVALTRHAAEAGADGALVVTPYYNRPTQEGLFEHFAAIAEAVDLPLVLYNVPVRCGVDLLNETVLRLCERCERIVGVKDASGGLERVGELVASGRVDVLCGDDGLTLPFMAHGATGVISVISNLLPADMKELVDASAANDYARARACHRKTCFLAERMAPFGPNPVPIKTAMAIQGLLAEEFRLPLCPMGDSERRALEGILRKFEVI